MSIELRLDSHGSERQVAGMFGSMSVAVEPVLAACYAAVIVAVVLQPRTSVRGGFVDAWLEDVHNHTRSVHDTTSATHRVCGDPRDLRLAEKRHGRS